MNYKHITVGIVTYKSEKILIQCLKSLRGHKKVIIFDNSNDKNLKKIIKKKYSHIKVILSKTNLGFGAGNNKIVKYTKSKYLFLISPDTRLQKNCIKNLFIASKKLNNDFSILTPSSNDKNFGYFKNNSKRKRIEKNIIKVDYVKGFAMFLNLKKFKNFSLFDERMFLYLEEIDLCKRLTNKKQNIFLIKNSYIKHLFAKSSDIGFEYERCRNWHWMWSKTYFNFKHKNFLLSLVIAMFDIFKNFMKGFLSIFFDKKKSDISFLRASGTFNALIGNKSYFRPKIN